MTTFNGSIPPLYYNEPRAVVVREPDDVTSMHTSVYGSFNILVDTQVDAQSVMDNWHVIMEAAAIKAQEFLTVTPK